MVPQDFRRSSPRRNPSGSADTQPETKRPRLGTSESPCDRKVAGALVNRSCGRWPRVRRAGPRSRRGGRGGGVAGAGCLSLDQHAPPNVLAERDAARHSGTRARGWCGRCAIARQALPSQEDGDSSAAWLEASATATLGSTPRFGRHDLVRRVGRSGVCAPRSARRGYATCGGASSSSSSRLASTASLAGNHRGAQGVAALFLATPNSRRIQGRHFSHVASRAATNASSLPPGARCLRRSTCWT